jgi:hypothetical protein
VSSDSVFLSHALVLGEKLLRACSTPSGLPYSNINLGNGAGTGTPWASGVRFLLRGEGPCQTCFAPFPRTRLALSRVTYVFCARSLLAWIVVVCSFLGIRASSLRRPRRFWSSLPS